MNNGWIKVHRKVLNSGYYNKSHYVHLWLHILLKANHKNKEIVWNGRLLKIKPGTFITGRKQLSNETGIPQTTIERILKCFESGHQIGQQKTNKYRLIIVKNWEKYQSNGQQTDNKRTTNGHKQEYKNVKNIRKLKNNSIITLNDGTKAKLYFGTWVDADNNSIRINRSAYPELKNYEIN